MVEEEPKYEQDDGPLTNEQLQEIADQYIEKKDTESSEELVKSEADWEVLESNPSWQKAKQAWKAENPNETLKHYKDKFLRGKIEVLPWEEYMDIENSNQESIEGKDDYIQNQEQSQNSLWNKIRNND